ncbi:TetR/AcrR family transcriptional regulator [bacterium]|nr:TetR/AcrR family transcriptional regulator [bacterium]
MSNLSEDDSKALNNRHDERREQLLDIAVSLFAKHGLEGTTTKDIAKAAGVSPGLLYHYYSSKEDLLLNVIKRFKSEANDELESDVLKLPVEEGLLRILNRFNDKIEKDRDLILTITRAASIYPVISDTLKQFNNAESSNLNKFLDEKIKSGEIRAVNSVRLSKIMRHVIVMEQLYGSHKIGEPEIKMYIDILLNGLMIK